MASRVWEAMAPKPRRFDLTMSRRTRRPPSFAISEEGSKTTVQQQDEVFELMKTAQCCPCSLHNSEDAEQHKASEQTDEQGYPAEEVDETEQPHCQDRRISLQELIQDDETLDGTAAGGQQHRNPPPLPVKSWRHQRKRKSSLSKWLQGR